MKHVPEPKTLQEAITTFSDPDNALWYMAAKRWPHGVVCPTCGRADVSFLETQLRWQCKSRHAKRQFSAKVGTLFEDSAIPLEKWLPAVWMLCNDKNGISSWEIHRALKVSQKTAWFMLHRIRMAMHRPGDDAKFGGTGGTVEADETFIGGKAEFMHKSRKLKLQRIRNESPDWKFSGVRYQKTAVQGILDRKLRQVRASVVPNVKRETLQTAILEGVSKGATICTDQAPAYEFLAKEFAHEVINHLREYVRGQVHTQGLDNFWSLLKRTLRGTYVSVEPFHLQKYVDEQSFRYNNRGGKKKEQRITDSQRFEMVMSNLAGKRLTYAELTGKVGDTASW